MRELYWIIMCVTSFITKTIITALKIPIMILCLIPVLFGFEISQPYGIFSRWEVRSTWRELNDALDKGEDHE